MDGFKPIPIQNSFTMPTEKEAVSPNLNSGGISGIEFSDEKKVQSSSGLNKYSFILSLISTLSLLFVLSYFAYLVVNRFEMLNQISLYTEQFANLQTSIDKSEIDDFIALESSLKVMNSKLPNHVLTSEIFTFINRHIRNNMQISEYNMSVREDDVSVSLVNVSPSFKELAEQTEKMFELKSQGQIKSFSVSNLAIEADGRRVRFTLNILFDRKTVSLNEKANLKN